MAEDNLVTVVHEQGGYLIATKYDHGWGGRRWWLEALGVGRLDGDYLSEEAAHRALGARLAAEGRPPDA